MSRTVPHRAAFSATKRGASAQLELSAAAAGPTAPRDALRRFLLLKYIQTLLLPLGNELLLAVGALASLYTLLLLSSPHVSRKASVVLLGQLARADGLLLLRWGLGLEFGLGLGDMKLSLGCDGQATPWIVRGLLLEAHHLASLLLLSCVSLEALLVSHWAAESRHVRTAHHAGLVCTLIWTGVALQLGLQIVGCCSRDSNLEADEGSKSDMDGGLIRCFLQICATLAPLSHVLMQGLQALLWVANTWVLYKVFYRKTQKGKSCFH
ncbi:hypothetical protein AALO_G00267440 [Alosa alosa]|uniref:Uncharacterized protein n=1 Tax=Alosa alosa TaxID=278164 RepID=A0AAV6FMF7_9TELE|nr:uncharacterized protein LOC121694405 [Alosa sapidissima]XP_048087843.1 uncharacterized protein LOC125286665 [Alosa alosa]KAG5263679.1 hypothetical protein AALO_G00267440 [Alosa alosa]